MAGSIKYQAVKVGRDFNIRAGLNKDVAGIIVVTIFNCKLIADYASISDQQTLPINYPSIIREMLVTTYKKSNLQTFW